LNQRLKSCSDEKEQSQIFESEPVVPLVLELGSIGNLLQTAKFFLDLPHFVFLDNASSDPEPRFSYLTAAPFQIIRSKGKKVERMMNGIVSRVESNPFQAIRETLARFPIKPIEGISAFQGGGVGYLAYELGRHLEEVGYRASDDHSLPEAYLGFYDWVIAYDGQSGLSWAFATGFPEGSLKSAENRLKWIKQRLSRQVLLSPPGQCRVAEMVGSNFSRDGYIDAVSKVRDYIETGDVYQVNLSQRFEATLPCKPWDLYCRLRSVNPAAYASFMAFPEISILSASPELYVQMEKGLVKSKPIKGTRPRGKTVHEDRALAAELLLSEKERAENVMIVDVVRNDLGRICLPGTVAVPTLFNVEAHPTLFQMVSTVTGSTSTEIDSIDLLQAIFPGASVTGAPKIRAMQIIDALEPTQRSVYCGALGYLGFDNSVCLSMPIRIMLCKEKRVYLPVGGGIVYDSDPEAEYEETLLKARGGFKALGF
jgi:para-aminobenzoate synthetase component 1